jgi:hypothetical protein
MTPSGDIYHQSQKLPVFLELQNGVFCPNHLDYQNYPLEVMAWLLHKFQHEKDVTGHLRRDYKIMTKKEIVCESF